MTDWNRKTLESIYGAARNRGTNGPAAHRAAFQEAANEIAAIRRGSASVYSVGSAQSALCKACKQVMPDRCHTSQPSPFKCHLVQADLEY
jgi:precorrin isomerase